ncbi:MAG: GFA family protein [Gaiellaceae bacterium]
MTEAVRGGCLCGGVRFEVEPPFRRANYCHCLRCRKHSGAGALVTGRVSRERFRLLAGEELIRIHVPEGGGAVKAFCSECGSSLFGGRWPEGDEVSIRLGSLDGDPGIRPQYRSYVDSKAPWEELFEDGLPRFNGANPSA